jgi:photosystem II stability/assembly factor-like uncharacterized protein
MDHPMLFRLLVIPAVVMTACLPLFAVDAAPLAVQAGGQAGGQAGESEPLSRPAVSMRRPDKAALLGVAMAGRRLVAVGERGSIVLSDDDGESWRQGRVPVSVTLTAVRFVSPSTGWAVGHSGIVLRTTDGGESWERQLDGRTAARLALEAAVKADPGGAGRPVARARRLVADGPDKPFLGLWFRDDREGLVVGAYGLIFRTADGGASWTPALDALDNPQEQHINALAATVGGTLYLAGEQGLLARSDDGGRHFRRLASPYDGAFFTVVADGDEVVAAGLRGAAYRSTDRGETWRRLSGGPDIAYNAAFRSSAGAVLLGNHAGDLFGVDAASATLVAVPAPKPAGPLTDLTLDRHGRPLVASLGGIARMPITHMPGGTP